MVFLAKFFYTQLLPLIMITSDQNFQLDSIVHAKSPA